MPNNKTADKATDKTKKTATAPKRDANGHFVSKNGKKPSGKNCYKEGDASKLRKDIQKEYPLAILETLNELDDKFENEKVFSMADMVRGELPLVTKLDKTMALVENYAELTDKASKAIDYLSAKAKSNFWWGFGIGSLTWSFLALATKVVIHFCK